jgi:hypothetical protein
LRGAFSVRESVILWTSGGSIIRAPCVLHEVVGDVEGGVIQPPIFEVDDAHYTGGLPMNWGEGWWREVGSEEGKRASP